MGSVKYKESNGGFSQAYREHLWVQSSMKSGLVGSHIKIGLWFSQA